MNTSADVIVPPRRDRGVLSVRILTWVAAAIYVPAYLLIPMGITVFWSVYLMIFGPVIAVDLAAVVGFVICRLTGRRISFAYLFISLAVLAAVYYVTWFELRLRWYEVF